jgi:predicted permease
MTDPQPLPPDRRDGPTSADEDVKDEVRFHLEMREHDFRERGLDDAAARQAALQRFGNVESVTTACVTIDEKHARKQNRLRLIDECRQDITSALRSLVRLRGFTIVAVVTLALGIGLTAAMFSIVQAVLLRPLPYHEPDRLVAIWTTTGEGRLDNLTPGRFLDFRQRTSSVTTLAGISHLSLTLTGLGPADRFLGCSVSTDFFDVLGVRAAIGDTFHAGERERAVVLGHGLWTRRFGGDASIAGRTVMLNGRPHRVAGIMPEAFVWPIVATAPFGAPYPEAWVSAPVKDVPLTPIERPGDPALNRRASYLRMIGRLKPGVSIDQAQLEATRIAEQLASEFPQSDGGRGARVIPFETQVLGDVRTPLTVLTGAAAFVLAIACANVAGLLIGRTASRRRELAVRMALGAGRARLMRQLLTEAVVLSSIAATAGVGLALAATHTLVALHPVDVLRFDQAQVDAGTLVFAAALAVIAGLAFGWLPALHATHAPVQSGLAESPRSSQGRSGRRMHGALVVAQIAVAVTLLVGAGLFLASFVGLQRVVVGLDPRQLLTFNIVLASPRADRPATRVAFYEEMLREIRSLPGVTSAAAAATLPIGGDNFGSPILVEGQPEPPPGREARAGFQVVSPGYFDAMRTPLIAGRDFTAADGPIAPPVIIVNERLAHESWPGEDPLGKRLLIGSTEGRVTATVVGVAGNVRHLGPATPPRPEFFQPHSQASFSFAAVVVRTAGEPKSMTPAIRARLAELDPLLPISEVATMEEHLRDAVARPRLLSALVGGFAAVALLLAAIGIYATMARAVTERRREIGIRMALGARPVDVFRLVLKSGVTLTVFGAAIGLSGGALAARAIRSELFETGPLDPMAFGSATLALCLVAMAAVYIPARRSTRIDPVETIRRA